MVVTDVHKSSRPFDAAAAVVDFQGRHGHSRIRGVRRAVFAGWAPPTGILGEDRWAVPTLLAKRCRDPHRSTGSLEVETAEVIFPYLVGEHLFVEETNCGFDNSFVQPG